MEKFTWNVSAAPSGGRLLSSAFEATAAEGRLVHKFVIKPDRKEVVCGEQVPAAHIGSEAPIVLSLRSLAANNDVHISLKLYWNRKLDK
ncbi:hypothetical protein EVAR_92521_1 [Eumeta japonica]|uniref:Uncharacterized protein n=1 Tax=Eumeta variegata TaxID=151549 RepID=A0A4C1T661_EUMVA|nr:hypothetical protein EVAR_92521_1 [Eumeta japonica]